MAQRVHPSTFLTLAVLVSIIVVYALGGLLIGEGRESFPGAPTTLRTHTRPAHLPEKDEPVASVLEASPAPSEPAPTHVANPFVEALPDAPFDVEAANWVTGRLDFPDAATPDDTLTIVATRFSPLEGLPFPDDEFADPEIRVGVDGDGVFRLAFPADWYRCYLELDGANLYLETPLPLVPTGKTTDVVLHPRLGANVRGRVRVSEGSSRPNGVIRLSAHALVDELSPAADVDVIASARARIAATPVDARGEFELRGLPPIASWTLVATARDRIPSPELVLRPGPGDELTVELTLAAGAVVSGTVLDDDFHPVPEARVTLRPADTNDGPRRVRRVVCDSQGVFRIPGVPDGDHVLQAELVDHFVPQPPRVNVRRGRDVSGLELRLSRGEQLAGRVVWFDGNPAERILLALRVAAPADAAPDFLGRKWTEIEARSADGRFQVRGLESGTYDLRATATRRVGSYWQRGTSRTLRVDTDGQESVLVLETKLPVNGRVVSGESEPVTRFEIHAIPVDSSLAETDVQGLRLAFASPDGTFGLQGFEPGEWEFLATAEGFGTSKRIHVRLPFSDPGSKLDFRLFRSGVVTGFVRDPDGVPLAGARIHVQAAEAETEEFHTWSGARPDARSEASGRFQVERLEPGRYRFFATEPGYARSEPVELSVAPGIRRSDATLVLRRGGRLAGRLYDGGGRPASNRPVHIATEPLSEARSVTTAADGGFRFEHVTPGTWRIWTLGDEAPPSADEELESRTIEVRENEETRVTLGRPRPSMRIARGSVLAGGEPVVAELVLFPDEASPLALRSTATATDGSFALLLGAPGRFLAAVSVRAGRLHLRREFALELDAEASEPWRIELGAARIAGRVVDNVGRAIPGAWVELLAEGPLLAISPSGDGFAEALTDEQGRFDFHPLAAGSYTLVARLPDRLSESAPLAWATTSGIAVDEQGRRDDLELVLRPGTAARGTVVGEDGLPLARATLHVFGKSGHPLGRFSSIRSDDAGRFELPPLGPGPHRVVARTAERVSSGGVFDIVPGTTPELVLRALPAAFLELTVRDDADLFVAVRVAVHDAEGQVLTGFEDAREAERLYDEGLRCEPLVLGPFPPGTCTLEVVFPDGERRSRTVELAPGATKRLTLRR